MGIAAWISDDDHPTDRALISRLLNECRSSACATVFLSQSVNNYFAAFTTNPEPNAYALLAGLGTKILHRNGDFKTNAWASDTISKAVQILQSGGENEQRGISDTDTYGSSSGTTYSPGGGGGSSGTNRSRSTGQSRSRGQSRNWSQHIDYQVQPETFTRLNAVGNIQAIVFKSGADFNGLPYTGATFRQN